MPLAFPDNPPAVLAHKIDEPVADDEDAAMGGDGAELAAGDPPADRRLAVTGCPFDIWREEYIVKAAPVIVEPRSEVFWRRLRLSCRRVAVCRERDRNHVFRRVGGKRLYVLEPHAVAMCFLSAYRAGDDSVLEHPRAFALADMEEPTGLVS